MKKWLVFVLLTVAWMVAACGGGTAPAPEEPASTNEQGLAPLDEPVTVKIAEDGSPSGAGFYIARERGYFNQLGINVEFVTFASSAEMLPSVATGDIDVAGGITSVALFNAVDRGLDIRIIGDKGRNIPGQSYFDLVVAKDKADEIKTYKDLEGRKIAIAGSGSIDEIFPDLALEQAGLTKEDIEYVKIEDFGQMNAALANGAVDAAMHIEPSITRGVQEGVVDRWIDATEWAPDTQIAIVLASPQFVQNEPLAKRFMVAYLKGLRDYNRAFIDGEDTAGIIEIMTEYTPMKDAELWRQVHVTGLHPNGTVNVDSLKWQLQWFKDMGYYEGGADIENMVDLRWTDFAVEQLGPYEGTNPFSGE